MGGWKLEVGKMVLYMAFPVLMFHYFNQPQYYEEVITKLKREIYPPQSKEREEELLKALNEVKRLRALTELTQLGEINQKQK